MIGRWMVIGPLLLAVCTFKSNGQDLSREQAAAVRAIGARVDGFNDLKRYLFEKAERLAVPQRERINKRAGKDLVQVVRNNIYFLDSRQSNAFVLAPDQDSVNKGELINHVFFTTALIRELYQHCAGDRDKFAKALTGVLAHEMGHPVEGVQDSRVSKGWNANSQSTEVAADGDGMYLLRAAGLPEDALYLASSLLFTEKGSDVAAGVLGSHPKGSLRLSLQRLGLTFGRRFLGLKTPADFKMGEDAWTDATSVEALPPPDFIDLKLPVLPLGTLAEAREAVGRRLRSDGKLEFNHVLLILCERIGGTAGELDEDFRKWLIDLILKIVSAETPRINYVQFPSPGKEKTEKQMSFEHLHPRSVDALLAQAPALNTNAFKNEFRAAFLERFGGNLLKVDLKPAPGRNSGPVPGPRLLFSSHGLNSIVTGVLRSEYWLDVFKAEWLTAINQLLDNEAPEATDPGNKIRYALADRSAARAAIQSLLGGLPARERLQAIKHFLQVNSSNPRELLHYFLTQLGRETLEPYLLSRYPFDDRNSRRDQLLIEAQREPELLAEIVDFHFDHAELFMLGDLARALQLRSGRSLNLEFGFVDWATLFRLKGVAPDYEALNKRFVAFVQSAEFVELAKYLCPLLEADDRTEYVFHSEESGVDVKSRPPWWSERAISALMDNKSPEFIRFKKLIMSRLYFMDRESFKARLPKFGRQSFSDWLGAILPLAYFEFEFQQDKVLTTARMANIRLAELATWYLDGLSAKNKKTSDPLEGFENWKVTPSAGQIYTSLSSLTTMAPASSLFHSTMTHDMKRTDDEEEGSEITSADSVYSGWETALAAELRALTGAGQFSDFLDIVFVYPTENPRITSAAYAELVDLALTKLKEFNASSDSNIKWVEKIITRGSTIGIDRYISDELWPALRDAQLSPRQLEFWVHRVSTQKLKLALVRLLFQQQGYGKYAGLQSSAGIRDFLADLNRLLPNRSLGKDQFIEQLGWDLNINYLDLLRRMNEGKSTADLHQMNPLTINGASGFAAHLSALTETERWDLIEYLITPGASEVPASALRHIDSLDIEPQIVRNLKVRLAGALQDIHAQSSAEKIPTVEFLLTVEGQGGGPLIEERSLIQPRCLAGLGIPVDSATAKLLDDYLEIHPSYESSSVLAYLLARKSENLDLSPSNMKDILEMHNIVGKKIGQGAHTWRLVPDFEQLRDLKDRGQPMTKLEIVEAAHAEWGEELAANIVEYQEPIAAGSIKTITRVKLKDGRIAALETQSPYAEDQIRATYDSVGPFVNRMQQRGLISSEPFINHLLAGLHGQIERELDFTQEADALIRAKPLFEQIESEMNEAAAGYRFLVPQPLAGYPVTRRLLLVEFANGVAFDRLPAEKQQAVGPVIFGAYSRALVLHGWIDSDRSVANQLIDPEARTIAILDLAQTAQLKTDAKSFRSDDRTQLLNFLLAMQEAEGADALEKAIEPLLSPESRPAWDAQAKAKFRADWQKRVSVPEGPALPVEERLIALMASIENCGVHMDERYSVYVLKGILTFLAEPYVDRPAQARILAEIARELIDSKKPVYLFKTALNRCAELLGGKR